MSGDARRPGHGRGPVPASGGEAPPAAGGDGEPLRPDPGVVAVLPAAGRSARMGSGVNKVFRSLAGQPVLARSLLALAAAGIGRFVIALRDEDRPLWEQAVLPLLPPELELAVVTGGAEREDSVYAALAHLAGTNPPRWVLVHDAARPLVPPALVRRVLAAPPPAGTARPSPPFPSATP